METRASKTETKRIADLDLTSLDARAETPDGFEPEGDIHPNSLQFRLDPRRRAGKDWDTARVLKYGAIILFLCFAVSMTLRLQDEFREWLIEDVKQMATKSKKRRIGKIAVPVLSQVSLILKAHRPATENAGVDPLANAAASCSTFISESITKKLKSTLTQEEVIRLANCQLYQDSPSAAKVSLEKSGITLESELSWETLKGKLLSLESEHLLKKLSTTTLYPRQGCLNWRASIECMMRYQDESKYGANNRWKDGFKVLEPLLSPEMKVEAAWFYLASSSYAMKEKDCASAEAHLQKMASALRSMPNPFLERALYKNAVLNAYLANDPQAYKKAEKFRPEARIEEDSRAFLDVELLIHLKKARARDTLNAFLTSSEGRSRFANDRRIVEIVLKEAQAMNLPNEALTYARAVMGKKPSIQEQGPDLLLLYARTMIGAGKYQDALELLRTLEQQNYQSAETHHLKGLATLYQPFSKGRHLLAAKEFQTAASLAMNDESLFAMFLALHSGTEEKKAEIVLSGWANQGSKAQNSAWFHLAQGIAQWSKGQKAEAEQSWVKAEKLNKNKKIWELLRMNLQSDATYFDREIASSLRFILPAHSPLGSLALLSP